MTAIALCVPIALLSWKQDSAPVDGLAVAIEAWKNATNSLSSGTGTGTFKYYERESSGKPWQIKTDARVTVFFDHNKYYIALECAKHRLGLKRCIIIYDGSAIFSSRFSPGISPVGCDGEVFAAKEDGGVVRAEAAGIPWDVTKLPYALVKLPEIVRNIGSEKILSTRMEGDYKLEHVVKNSPALTVKIDCPRRFAYNCAARRVTTKGSLEPLQEFTAEWSTDGGIWYVKSIRETYLMGDRGYRWELTYDEFKANATVPISRFQMSSLEMPGGARILDHRKGAAERARFIPVADGAMEAAMESMVKQLESLPVRSPGRQIEVRERSHRWLFFWIVNGLVAIVVLCLVLRRARKVPQRGGK